MLIQHIEQASLNAWPALQHMLYDGWILRFSKGYTKRANSVNPLYPSSLNVNQKIAFCEACYAARGLPPIFRLTPLASPPELDQALESRGYQKIDLTLVMHRDLQALDVQAGATAGLRREPLDDWLTLFCRFRGAPLEKHQVHKEILQAIPARRFLASLVDSGQAVACGLGVLEGPYFGLFDLITDPQQRNKGYGTRLVSGLLGWARENGAQHAYLQVVETNAPARHLYADKLGFSQLYQYWYRVPEPG